ncbi:MAG: hypothetical protein FWD17_02295, partial [Polyangiaceae bacterium]|nr:hypothetical protein [Polyangiaceae bacterium]
LVAHDDEVDAVLDDDGRPRVVTWAAGALSATSPPPSPEPAAGDVVAGLTIACAVAGDQVFCPDKKGLIRRSALHSGGDAREAASGRTGGRIAAGLLGGSHAALAYLASRQTSEGWMSEAWIAVGDDPPVRLSDEGSGATSVAFAQRGAAILALLVDARAALTAMHARPVTFDGRVHLGEDVVVFVGGPGDRRTGAVPLLPPSGPGWGLLPIAKDIGEFGLAVVRLDDPPRVDEPTTWSMYPNGLDPAPIAAVVHRGTSWVARVRPETAQPGSARFLELGTVGGAGAFDSVARIKTHGSPSDVALTADLHGALWVAWVDPTGSWGVRLACKD